MFMAEKTFRTSSYVVVLLLWFISLQKSSVTGSILEFESEENVTAGALQCSKGCKAETCINGTTCECLDGYTGDDCSVCKSCSQFCPRGTYGPNCNRKCRCKNGRWCDSVYGTCFCNAGYTGHNCSERCEEGTYGLGCNEKCRCGGNVRCHHVTGDCRSCPSGFIGKPPYCNCDPLLQGENCTESCSCLKYGTCSIQNDTCACSSEWTGKNCICYSAQTEFVDPDSGKCTCKPRWWGRMCTLRAPAYCPPSKYGEDCGCLCENYGTLDCDGVTRTCICKNNFSGKYCEKCFCDDTGNCSSKIDCLLYSIRLSRKNVIFTPIFTRTNPFDFPQLNLPNFENPKVLNTPRFSIRKFSAPDLPTIKVPKKSFKAIFAVIGGFLSSVASVFCYCCRKRNKTNSAQPQCTDAIPLAIPLTANGEWPKDDV